MEFRYTVKNDESIIKEVKHNDGKKIKEPIVISISVKIEQKKYEKIKEKNKLQISEKIFKIFK